MDLSVIREICHGFYVADDKWFRYFRPLGHKNPGELNFREGPTMLLKIKEKRSDILDGPTIMMKTRSLSFLGHDVHEKKYT